MRTRRRNTAKIIRLILAILFASMALFSAFMLLKSCTENKAEEDALTALQHAREQAIIEAARDASRDAGTETTEESDDPEETGRKEPEILPEYRRLYAENPDLFGWVEIENTPVSYPVMFTPEDPEYYLRRNFEGNYARAGVPFLDGYWTYDMNFLMIYGHHITTDPIMFGTLPKYAEKSYRDAHPIIKLDTLYARMEYEVIAAVYSQADTDRTDVFKYYKYHDLSDEATFNAFMEGVEQYKTYDTGLSARWGDDILVLSTCNYHVTDGRFAVIAKRIR